ncbi:MAG: DUF2442 domain-containing protein [Hominilimicola sp.]
MFEKIKSVEPLNDFILRAVFENGVTKLYDVKPVMNKIDVFQDLKNNNIFKNVKVDTGGYGISWNDYIDLECTEIWDNGITQKQEAAG